MRHSGFTSFFSFIVVLVGIEVMARVLAPSLPVDQGKWPRPEIPEKLEQMEKVSENQDVGVVFMGSSMMANGVDPVAFTEASGMYAYNAAFLGPSIRTMLPWTRDIVEPLLEPDVILIGIQSRELNDSGGAASDGYRDFISSPGYRQQTSSFVGRFEDMLEDWSAFLRYRRAVRRPLDLDEDSTLEGETRFTLGPQGTRSMEDGHYRNTENFQRRLGRALQDYSVGGVQYDALLRLHSVLVERGVKVVVMSMPVTADYDLLHEDPVGDMAAYHDLLTRFEAATGVAILDAEDAFPSSTPFREPTHLDLEGSSALARALAENWELILDSDHRLEMTCKGRSKPVCDVR